MDQLVASAVHLIVQVLVRFSIVVVAFALVALPTLLVFPSTRATLARWLRRGSRSELDQGEVLAQLAATNEQMAALRSEVYALRADVASLHALREAPRPAILLPPNSHTRSTP